MKALDLGLGHLYFDIIRNEQMIKFHIGDYWNQYKQQEQEQHQQRNFTTIEAQPTTSIQVSSRARPIMIVGQSESVFAQYLARARASLHSTCLVLSSGSVQKANVCFFRNLKATSICCQPLCLESWNSEEH